MIKLCVMYPALEGARFDFDYYRNVHIPKVCALLGDACKGVSIEQGMCGSNSQTPAAYVAMVGLLFASDGDFEAAFGPVAGEIMADLPNFTDMEPLVQINAICS